MGESQNGGYKKAKHAKFFENEHFLNLDTHTYRVKNVGFLENVACFVF